MPGLKCGHSPSFGFSKSKHPSSKIQCFRLNPIPVANQGELSGAPSSEPWSSKFAFCKQDGLEAKLSLRFSDSLHPRWSCKSFSLHPGAGPPRWTSSAWELSHLLSSSSQRWREGGGGESTGKLGLARVPGRSGKTLISSPICYANHLSSLTCIGLWFFLILSTKTHTVNTPLSFYSLYFHVLIAGLGVMTQYPSCRACW